MIFNMNDGGASLLNFNVIGGASAPDNPKENTIFVKTDIAITKWIFSTTQPSSPTSGMVWIPTTKTDSLNFNALKKNGVMVYIDSSRSVKQYIDGQWVAKNALIYANNKWVQISGEWDGYYFKNGDQYTEYTGGWTGGADTNSSYSVGSTLRVWCDSGGSDANDAWVGTAKQVDLTNVNTLYATVSKDNGDYSIYMLVGKERTNWAYADKKVKHNGSTYTYDVSTLSGSYYIYFNGAGGMSGIADTSISAVWGV